MSVDIKTVNVEENVSNVNRKLSEQQKEVLCYLFSLCREREDYFMKTRETNHCTAGQVDPCDRISRLWKIKKSCYPGGGGCYPSVCWCPGHFLQRNPTRSESASLSRCLKRLYERQLINYGRYSKSSLRPLAVEIKLERTGRNLASSLLRVVDPYPTEKDYQLAYYPHLSIDQITEMRTLAMAQLEARFKRLPTSKLGQTEACSKHNKQSP